jgi:hypothetical protein
MFSRFLMSSAVAAWVSLLSVVSCGPTSASNNVFARTLVNGIDVKLLSPFLSKTAQIYLQDTEQFKTYTTRWSNLETPTINLVVVAGTEQDVATVVSFLYRRICQAFC